ncbi:MAG: glycosyltransferase [Eggerthellaceae bacterium]|nr:glycosyltransferase [Eggerthellaceae bacterium]
MESIKVSVLVPIYNVEKYLRQCLDSLKNQTLHDIEIICINDGSTDSSPEIIREYCEDDDRFKVINKANSGYGDSMNQGLAMARGEYIGIVESDDFASPDMFESLYTLASENDADVTKSNYLEYSLNGYEVRDFPVENLFFCEFNKVFTPADDQNVFLSAPAIWSAIYRREYLEKNNIRFLPTPGAYFQDTSFNFKALALADRAILTHDAYLHYRVDNASSSVKSQAKIFTVCDEYDEIWDFINRYPELRAKLATAIPIFQFGG